MTGIEDIAEKVKKTVVAIDFCSSSDILEDLLRTESFETWRDFIIHLKNELVEHAKRLKFKIYKFTGDGWILLFPDSVRGDQLFEFLILFSQFYEDAFNTYVKDELETEPKIIGLTIGIESGTLIKMTMNRRVEYIGRALNVACRFQSAVKENDDTPQYKVIISNHHFRKLKDDILKFDIEIKEVQRKLRNIADDKVVRCKKIKLI